VNYLLTDEHDELYFDGEGSVEDFKSALRKYRREHFCCGSHADCPLAIAAEVQPDEELWGEILEQEDAIEDLSRHMFKHGFMYKSTGDPEAKVHVKEVSRAP